MSVLSIVQWPDKLLSTPCERVTAFDAELSDFIDDMVETMVHAKALGLAAPQVGKLLRVIVVLDMNARPLVMVNPEALTNESAFAMRRERCLSMPGITASVRRQSRVTVSVQDRTGAEFTAEYDEHTACAIQHEMDHLDGVVMVDHESPLKRQLAANKMRRHARYANGATP